LGPPPASRLPEQLRLFGQARDAARAGEYDRALTVLEELERNFPQGPLGDEIQLLRVQVLYRSGRYQEATERIGKLLDDPALAGKKPQLLRLLGDAWVHLGRCDLASEAFRRALGLGLEGQEAEAARRGLKSCVSP
jgi:predicted Zn-dependent protease